MAYTKSKHVDAAQKYLQQGKLAQAIAEYQQILKHEPNDQVTLMTLGDLFVRQGETSQAVEYFERLAKIFLNDGFTTKAIAIYKKVAKLAPEETRALERLAELYVQQGVLSEARPLYLQLAEVHLKAGRQPEGAELLGKLLEAEPDNMRVLTRLAELDLAMGREKDALNLYHGATQRVMGLGDYLGVIRLADRILQIDAGHLPTLQLKARALAGANKSSEAAALLESFPDRDDGGETTTILLEQYMVLGQVEKAAGLAEKIYALDHEKYPMAHQVAIALLEAGNPDRAQVLLGLIRDTMIDSGDHEALAQSISKLAELRPGQIEPLEWLVNLFGRASDSFRLPDALAQLAEALEAAGNNEQAIATYQQLLERTPEDETTRRKYLRLREKMGLEPITEELAPPVKMEMPELRAGQAPAPVSEPILDEETQLYVTQSLTDVDLFSSYGLAQKAIELLETVLERAPRHTLVLERLIDLSVGTGNNQRTAELAALLEQIAIERKDHDKAEHWAELRRRFQRAKPPSPVQPAPSSPSSPVAPPEFALPTIQAELDEPIPEAPQPPLGKQENGPTPGGSTVHEVDLSDEWEALSIQLEDAMSHEAMASPDIPDTSDAAFEIKPAAAPTPEVIPEAPVTAELPVFDLELQPAAPAAPPPESKTLAGDALFAELAMDFDSATTALGIPSEKGLAAPPQTTPQIPPAAIAPPANRAPDKPNAPAPDSSAPTGSLSDLFEEFRSEMGESTEEDEDLETHYNLGIAYREMGLMEEAIGEFQKVAKACEKGQEFRYAMQCCTLLGLAFMEKGQPSIAVIWYQRALLTPGLDQESILALRYDLGVAQEMAGETAAAFNTFSQVYAMSIDYRDVSMRIAVLEKAR